MKTPAMARAANPPGTVCRFWVATTHKKAGAHDATTNRTPADIKIKPRFILLADSMMGRFIAILF
jgi:hypothetical protein